MMRTDWLKSMTLGALTVAVMALSGCEDAQARQRDDVQQTLTDAVAELRSATGAVAADTDAARSKLEALANRLAAINEGAPGQRAAAALLAAEANEALGRMALDQAERIEAAHATDRLVLHTVVDVAGRLDAIASGRQAVTETERLASLAQQHQQITGTVQVVSQTIAGLDAPIDEIRRDNRQDAGRRDELRQRSEALYRQAAEQGRSAGLEHYQQATQLLRQAQQVERRMAGRDLELQYQHQPALDLAQSQVRLQQSLLQQIDEARSALDELDQEDQQQIAALEQRVADFRTSIQQMRDAMNASMGGELTAAYEAAARHFEQAAGLADRAAGQGDRSAAARCRLAAVASRQMLAETHAARARGLADHASLLLRLQSTGDALANPQAIVAEAQKTLTDQQTAQEQAKQAVTAALESVDQAGSRGNESSIAELKQRLQATQARLEGRPPSSAPPPAEDDAAWARGAAEPPAGDSTGYPSPEELLVALQSVNPADAASLARYVQTWRAVSASGRQTLAFMRAILMASAPLNQALAERFGAQALQDANAGAAMGGSISIPDFSQATISSRSDDKATITAPTHDGGSMEIECVRVDSLWYVNVDSLLPRDQRMTSQDLVAMQQSAQLMTAVMSAIAQRVRDGEFQSMEEAMQALMEESMKQAMESMRGAGSPGSPGAPGAARPPAGRGRSTPAEPEK